MVGFTNRTLARDDFLSKLNSHLEGAWFIELCSDTRVSAYRVQERLYETETKFQHLELLDLAELGPTLVLDGRIQLSKCDEHIYHEMLVHPAIVMATNPVRPPVDRVATDELLPIQVLVLGGGDGCVVREVLKWPHVEHVRLVELDDQMIDVFRNRVPEWNDNALNDPRCEVQCRDAIEVLDDDETWDVIIGDLTEPFDLDGTGRQETLSDALYRPAFFQRVENSLNEGGVYAAQTGGVFYVPEFDRHHVRIVHDFVDAFGDNVNVAMEYVRAYDSCLWTCTFAMPKGGNILSSNIDTAYKIHKAGIRPKLRYYNERVHDRLFTQIVPQIYARD